ncbi:MAG: copper resistance protein B [Gammaproteobacteria bacterium]|nr:copper resistance protein B [Gammaproteobacteria bacterium]MDP2347275.1 copper resistance protein B [Gammaproteobacteria bacterium]
MKTNLSQSILTVLLSTLSLDVLAQVHDNPDPLLGTVVIEQLEWRDTAGEMPLILEGHGWLGYDLHKLWIKTDVEVVEGEVEEAEIQALYSRAISAFWDMQVGARVDLEPSPSQTWGVIGVQGLAPYFYDIDAALFIGGSGDLAARVSAEYEIMLTQNWVLSPELSLDFFGQDDRSMARGSGLATAQAGLRLRYEIRREFAPYVGINWNRMFGSTADFARASGEDVSDTHWVFGVRAWF